MRISVCLVVYVFVCRGKPERNDQNLYLFSCGIQHYVNTSICACVYELYVCLCVCVSSSVSITCTTFHRYPIFSKRYSVLWKVYTGYCGTSEIEHGLCACTVDNPLAKARGLSLRTGAQTMLYLPLVILLYTILSNSQFSGREGGGVGWRVERERGGVDAWTFGQKLLYEVRTIYLIAIFAGKSGSREG